MAKLFFIAVAGSLAALIGFGAGYYYRAAHTPVTAEIADYALVNVLEDLTVVHYLAKGEFAPVRSMLDVSLNGHLSRVRAHGGGSLGPEADAARTRTLNAVAVLWDRYPPFQSPEWHKSESNASWWSEWSANHRENLALVQKAKAQCAANPQLNCKAQAPASRFPAEVK